MCCPGEDYVLLANVAQKLAAFHSFLGLLPSTATLQFLSPKRALRVHGLRFQRVFTAKFGSALFVPLHNPVAVRNKPILRSREKAKSLHRIEVFIRKIEIAEKWREKGTGPTKGS